MPALAERPEIAEDFATVIKNLAQPPVEPRENTPPPPKAAEVPAPKQNPPPAKSKAEAEKSDAQPAANESDHVFGTAIKPKTEDAKPDEEFETALKAETAGMTPKAEAKWADLRRTNKDMEEKLRHMEEKLRQANEAATEREAALKGQSAPDAKLETLTKQVQELQQQLIDADSELSLTKVERSQKYRRDVAEPIGELAKSAEELATRYEVPAKSVMAALEIADPKERSEALAELAADFNEPDRLDLYSIGKDMARLRRKGEEYRAKAKADLSAVEQEEQEERNRAAGEQSAVRARAAQATWETAARDDRSLRSDAAAPGWSAELEAAQRASREYEAGKDASADGALIARGMMLSFVQRKAAHFEAKFKEAMAENEKLLTRIETDGALDPSLGGNGSDAPHEAGDELEDGDLGRGAKMRFSK